MSSNTDFYICPTCFRVCETEMECHQHRMVACNPGDIGDMRRSPVKDPSGKFVSRAPRWYMEAVGWIKAE